MSEIRIGVSEKITKYHMTDEEVVMKYHVYLLYVLRAISKQKTTSNHLATFLSSEFFLSQSLILQNLIR